MIKFLNYSASMEMKKDLWRTTFRGWEQLENRVGYLNSGMRKNGKLNISWSFDMTFITLLKFILLGKGNDMIEIFKWKIVLLVRLTFCCITQTESDPRILCQMVTIWHCVFILKTSGIIGCDRLCPFQSSASW